MCHPCEGTSQKKSAGRVSPAGGLSNVRTAARPVGPVFGASLTHDLWPLTPLIMARPFAHLPLRLGVATVA